MSMGFSVFEALMLICFGISWPFAVYRSHKARSARGKSLSFLIFLFLAYVCGVLHKALINFDLVIVLYAINLAMVTADILLYLRNARLDKQADAEKDA